MTTEATVPRRTTSLGEKILNIGLWIAQLYLAASFGALGYMKATMPIDALAAMWHWPADLPELLVRFIGVMEILGAVGILLPAITRIMPFLTPLAALGFLTLQILAIAFHSWRGEFAALPFNVPLILCAAFALWGRASRLPIRPR